MGGTRMIPYSTNMFHALFDPVAWTKYFDHNQLNSTLPDDFLLQIHHLDSVDAAVTFNPIRFGTHVIAAASQDAAAHLAALSSIRETPLLVTKNARLNASISTVILLHHVATGVGDLKDCHVDIKHILEA